MDIALSLDGSAQKVSTYRWRERERAQTIVEGANSTRARVLLMEHVYHVVGQIWPLPGLTPPTGWRRAEKRAYPYMMGGQKLRLRAQYTRSIGAELYYRNDAYLLLLLELMYSLTGGGNTSTVGA